MNYDGEWEIVNQDTRRLKVPHGWLVNVYTTILMGDKCTHSANCLEFVPDSKNEWLLK